MNGLIVTYRKQFDCYQLKDTMNNNNRAYRLVPRFSNEKCVKEIQDEGGFINFTLEEGDTVYMTYYKGIMLDFRQVLLRISLKEKNSSSEPLRFEKKAEFESESETKHMGSIRKHPLIFTDTSMDRPKNT